MPNTKFTEGQEVFCILHGDGIVRNITGETLTVDFCDDSVYYSERGFSLETESEMQLLYPCRPKILSIPRDTKVWVWNGTENANGRKIGAYFSHFSEEGKPVVYGSGQTSWTQDHTTEYEYFEVVK